MKYFIISLCAALLSACSGTQGYQRTGMDQTRHFEAQPMDAYYAQQSAQMIHDDAGKSCWRLGAGPTRPISFHEWSTQKREGVFYEGHGYVCGDHAVQYGCYFDHGHLVHFGCGPITTSLWKNGGERGSVKYW